MTEKSYVFSFVSKGLNSLISGIGKATDKIKESGKELKRLKENFSKMYEEQRGEGKGIFSSLSNSLKGSVMQAGGLMKVLMNISRLGAGGILLFLGSKALQNNLGGISTAIAKIQATLGRVMAKLHIAINSIMKAMDPFFKILVDIGTGPLIWFLDKIAELLDALAKAPKWVQILVGSLTLLGLVLWAFNANPVFITIAAAVGIIWAVYKGIKAIVDLIKGNSKMTMNADVNVAGKNYQMIGKNAGSNSSDNSVHHTQNNVYVQGSGSGVNDAKVISNELSLLSSVSKAV
jgi:hypothetical protein